MTEESTGFISRAVNRIGDDLRRKVTKIQDVLSVVFAALYIALTVALILLGFSNLYLAVGLISVTASYLVFCLCKLFAKAKSKKSAKVKKAVGIICRCLKYAMRLTVAAFSVVSLITMPPKNKGYAIASAVFSFMTIILSVLLEIFRDPILKRLSVIIKNEIWDSVKEGVKEELKSTVAATIEPFKNVGEAIGRTGRKIARFFKRNKDKELEE